MNKPFISITDATYREGKIMLETNGTAWFQLSPDLTVHIIADYLEESGQYVTNDASREAALAEARAAGRVQGLEEAANLVETTRETTTIVGGGEALRHLTVRRQPDHDLTGRTWAKTIRALKQAEPAPKEDEAVLDAIATWPEEIWLNAGDDPLEAFEEYYEVTWCSLPQGEHDVRYVRADLTPAASPDTKEGA